MIETKKDVNVKDLIIGDPRVYGLPFNPDTYMSQRDWNKLDYYVDYSVDNKWVWAGFLIDAKILAPWVTLSQDKWDLVKEKAKREEDSFRSFLFLSATSKLYFPDKFHELGITDERWPELFEGVVGMKDVSISMDPIQSISWSIRNLAILFPQKLDEIKNNRSLKAFAYHRLRDIDPNLEVLVVSKLIFPEILDEMDLLHAHAWRVLIDELSEKRHKDPMTVADITDFFMYASKLSILAAKEVAITDEGIQLYFDDPNKSSETRPLMPRVRKF